MTPANRKVIVEFPSSAAFLGFVESMQTGKARAAGFFDRGRICLYTTLAYEHHYLGAGAVPAVVSLISVSKRADAYQAALNVIYIDLPLADKHDLGSMRTIGSA